MAADMAAQPRVDALLNQSPPYLDVDLYASDQPLRNAVASNGGDGDAAALSAFGKHWGSAGMFELGRQANENPPKLKTFDAKGFRRDFIEFHPAYHELMAASLAAGLQASTWRDDATPAAAPAQVIRAARFYMAAQVETGHLCPITMTRAAVAALAVEPPARRQADAQDHVAALRPPFPSVVGEDQHHARHGNDGEAGRHRRARQPDTRGARGRRLRGQRRQMVHVGADVRRLPGAGAGAGRADMCPDAALSPGRIGQRTAFPAPQGQARQPFECVLGGRVHGRLCLARGRGGQGRAHHHQHGAAHPARLRHRVGRHHAHGACPGAPPCPPPHACSRSIWAISR